MQVTIVKNLIQKQDPGNDVIIDGMHLPNNDKENDADAHTTPVQSPVSTQSAASTPIPGSDSSRRNHFRKHYDYLPLPGNGRGGWMICLRSWCTIV